MACVKMCKVTRAPWASNSPVSGPKWIPQFPHPKTEFCVYLNPKFPAQVASCLLLQLVGASFLGLLYQDGLYAGMCTLILRSDQAGVFGGVCKELG